MPLMSLKATNLYESLESNNSAKITNVLKAGKFNDIFLNVLSIHLKRLICSNRT